MKRILILCLSLALLLACVPTPEEGAVISKAESSTLSSSAFKSEQIQAEYRKTLTENKVTVAFDAAVQKPDGDCIPSHSLRACGISEQQLSAIVKALFGDAPVYDFGQQTKEDLYPALLEAMELLEKVKANPDQYEAGVDFYQDEVNDILEEYNAAPDSSALVPKEVVYAINEEDRSGVFGCCGRGGRSTNATLFVNTAIDSKSDTNTFLTYQNPNSYTGISLAREVVHDLTVSDPLISKEEAIETAVALAERMEMTDLKVAGAEPGVLKVPNTGWYEADPNETPYLVFFTRCMDGVQVTLDTHIYSENDFGKAYVEPMAYERLTVGVDSKGVCFVQWNGPVSVENRPNENCPILGVDQSAAQAAKYLSFLYPVSDALNDANAEGQAQSLLETQRGSVQSCTVHIDRIALGWMQVRDGASAKESTLIPVWDFFGTVERTYENGETERIEGGLVSLLTLDAQTGARIDRKQGY